jgi:hypothetical protein
MARVFTFTLSSSPTPHTPIVYEQPDGYSLSVTYGPKSFLDDIFPINQIVVNHALSEGQNVPTAPGRSRITSQSLQIPYFAVIHTYPPKLPTISVGEAATVSVTGLGTDETDGTCLRSGVITLTIGTKTYTLTPTRFADNRIAAATYAQTGGRKRKSKRRATKRKTRRSVINSRNYK